jgi:hypothetical protein
MVPPVQMGVLAEADMVGQGTTTRVVLAVLLQEWPSVTVTL